MMEWKRIDEIPIPYDTKILVTDGYNQWVGFIRLRLNTISAFPRSCCDFDDLGKPIWWQELPELPK